MPQIKGIDVSHHQGDIDWKKVAAAGIKFAFIKATEGKTFVDPKFEANVNGANAAGLKTGAYHFARFGCVEEAKKEAQHFLSVIKNVELSYPAVLDLEVDQKNVGKTKLTDAALAFLKEVEKAGYTAMLYSGKLFLENHLEENRLKKYPLWIARYSRELGRNADVWQFTSTGKVNGIRGNVDINWAYRDFAQVSNAKVQPPKYQLPNGILKRGSRGEAVKQLQRALNAANFKCGQVDGVYGSKTEDAVRRFQMVYLPYEVDGIYGPRTKAKLAEVLGGGK